MKRQPIVTEDSPLADSSWGPVDLGRYLRGDQGEDLPTLLARTDGGCLLYPGKIHAFNAESEAGKTWLALLAVKQQVDAGDCCVFLDFEDGPKGIAGRLATLGLAETEVAEGLLYARPEEALGEHILAAFVSMVTTLAPTLVVMDGFTEVMALHSLSINANDDVATLIARLVRPLAGSGAAVVMLDHVTKAAGADSRYAIGAQHKLAAVTGAAYRLVVEAPIGRGLHGRTRLELVKDRPGYVREISSGSRVGVLHVDATSDATSVWIEAPSGAAAPSQSAVDMVLATAIYELVAAHGAPINKRKVREQVRGNHQRKDRTIDWMIDEGHLVLDIIGQRHLLTAGEPLATTAAARSK